MLDRTRRLVSGAVDLAKEVVGPGKKVEEGRTGLDAFADGLDAHLGDLRFGRHRRRVVEQDGRGDEEQCRPQRRGDGRLLIILDEAGHVASVDPKTGDRREIADVLVIPGGRAVSSSGLALFQAKGKENEDGEEEEPDGRLVAARDLGLDRNLRGASRTVSGRSVDGDLVHQGE